MWKSKNSGHYRIELSPNVVVCATYVGTVSVFAEFETCKTLKEGLQEQKIKSEALKFTITQLKVMMNELQSAIDLVQESLKKE
jgi:hypothetical protein